MNLAFSRKEKKQPHQGYFKHAHKPFRSLINVFTSHLDCLGSLAATVASFCACTKRGRFAWRDLIGCTAFTTTLVQKSWVEAKQGEKLGRSIKPTVTHKVLTSKSTSHTKPVPTHTLYTIAIHFFSNNDGQHVEIFKKQSERSLYLELRIEINSTLSS